MKATTAVMISLAFLVLIGGSGCTLSHVSSVVSNYPQGTPVDIKCKDYSEKMKSLAKGIVKEEKKGWKPKVIGFKHTNMLGILSSKITVCYERPKKGASAPTKTKPTAALKDLSPTN